MQSISFDFSNIYSLSNDPQTSLMTKIILGNHLIDTASEFLTETQTKILLLKQSNNTSKRILTTPEKILLLDIFQNLIETSLPKQIDSNEVKPLICVFNEKISGHFTTATLTKELTRFKSKLSKIRKFVLIAAKNEIIDHLVIRSLKLMTEEFHKQNNSLASLSKIEESEFTTFKSFTRKFNKITKKQFSVLNSSSKNQAIEDLQTILGVKELFPIVKITNKAVFENLKTQIATENALWKEISEQIKDLFISQMIELHPTKLGLKAPIPLCYYNYQKDCYFTATKIFWETRFITPPRHYPVECIDVERSEPTMANDEKSFGRLKHNYMRVKEECHEPMLKCLPEVYPISMPNLLSPQMSKIDIEKESHFKKLAHLYSLYFYGLDKAKQTFDKRISANILFLHCLNEIGLHPLAP